MLYSHALRYVDAMRLRGLLARKYPYAYDATLLRVQVSMLTCKFLTGQGLCVLWTYLEEATPKPLAKSLNCTAC